MIFGLWRRRKRELEKSLIIFEIYILSAFHGQSHDGKSKDPLTGRAAVKSFAVLSSLHLISPFSPITQQSLVVSFKGVSDWLFTIKERGKG